MKDKDKLENFAKSLLQGIYATEKRVKKNEKATARYWNGDDWDSISGICDASNWIDNRIIKYIVKRIRKELNEF